MSSYRNSEPPLPIMQGSPPALVPPRMDWDRPPWNRWTFQNIRQVLPTAEVWRGNGPVRALPRADRDLDGLAVSAVSGAETTLAGLLDETYTDGFLVLKDGAIVYERYFNAMDWRSCICRSRSRKSVTAGVAGILVGPRRARRQCAGHRLSAGTERHGLSRRDAAACARHDERRAFRRDLYRPLFRYRPDRCGLGLEAGSARCAIRASAGRTTCSN